jgi:hypothetical protein
MNIEQKALELIDSRRRATAALSSGDLDLWLEIIPQQFRLIEELQGVRLRNSVIIAKNLEVAEVLREIDPCGIENPSEVGERLLYDWFDSRDYALGLARADAFISTITVPTELQVFIGEARQCYALGQYCAVYALSRTILETALTDICLRISFIPADADPKRYYWDYPLKKRIERLATGTLKDRIKTLYYDKTSVLIHGGTTAHGGDALEALAESLALVHLLYEIHLSASN